MRRNKLALYIHLVWATWDRQPLIAAELERRLHRNIESQARELGCVVLGLNGTEDHVHLLVSLPTTISIAELVKQVKGVSSRFVNDVLRPEAYFKWQGSYGAFTVSPGDLDRLVNYIQRQKEHHQTGQLVVEWEQTFEEVEASRVASE